MIDIVFNFDNMMSEAIGSKGIEPAAVDSLVPQVRQIHQGLTDLRKLGQLPFCDLPTQETLIDEVIEKAKRAREAFDYFLVLGIGGSSLGASMLTTSLGGDDSSLVVCEFLEYSFWKRKLSQWDLRKILVIVVSKSGKTLETLAAYAWILEKLKEKLGVGYRRHLFFITDPREGPLRQLATVEKVESLSIPPGVGGRYSVLTPAGLFPAACAGVDIRKLMLGAHRMDQRCQKEDPWENPAWMTAILHYLFDRQKNRRIRALMTYGEKLKGYGPWFAQLWAESLGKEKSLTGECLFAGSTPVCAQGPADQHSQLQLYLEGPEDKTVSFFSYEREMDDLMYPESVAHIPEIAFLRGKSAHTLLRAEKEATEQALTESERPNQSILLKEITPDTIGQLLMMAEMETVFAGELYQINPFDQPAVEKIKKHIINKLR